ncbi:MAG TPA: isochorismatase family protein [bacterium]|nr:isochorismatase family protein [bacterium]
MGKDAYGRITKEDSVLLIIDVQEKFVPHIKNIDEVIANCSRMASGCRAIGVPIIVTEQYPEGLGRTVPEVQEAIGDTAILEKTAFSVFADPAIASEIEKLGRPNLMLAGVEAHVCLIKTALDALAAGYNVHWIDDAISSRTKGNVRAARDRARRCGAFPSSAEMALFQLISSSKDEHFRAISKLVK